MSRKEFLEKLKPNKKKYTSNKLDFDGLKKRISIGIATGLLSVTVLGFSGCAEKQHDSRNEIETSDSYSVTVDPYEYLNTPSAFLQDFKEHYIEKYNQDHSTDYTPSQIQVSLSHPEYLFETPYGLVTHGNYPNEVSKELSKYGECNAIGSAYNIDLYQIILKDDGKALESVAEFFSRDGNYVSSSVFSGNNLPADLTQQEKCTLLDCIKLCKIATNIVSNNEITSLEKTSYIEEINGTSNDMIK